MGKHILHHGCRACEIYSISLQRCLTGKINPRTFRAATSGARVMGLGYICNKNKMVDKIIERRRINE
jgi:hypothetical protein